MLLYPFPLLDFQILARFDQRERKWEEESGEKKDPPESQVLQSDGAAAKRGEIGGCGAS
ncbi:hypothetical protein CDL15_Pgr004434 [Punica granatum]|uniref:Uncharacterized protein n=1 Tax=Punica granatum TaxID=22663 RepID=A0A218XGE6_PUNGR|nr:hypothetical protein CDL15_Pgr004434 [Punica granatum]